MNPVPEPITLPAHSLHVGLLLGPGFAGWCAHERSSGKLIALHTAFRAELPHTDLIPREAASASCVVLPEWSILVPESALVPGSEAVHWGASFGREPLGTLRTEGLELLDAQTIHTHDPAMERSAHSFLPHARTLSLQALLVRAAMAQRTDRDVLLVHCSTDRIDVVLAVHGSILLSNTFPARTSEDVLYFALLAAERCKRKPEELQLLHAGPLAHDRNVVLLERYFQHCAPATAAGLPGQANAQHWLALTEQFACV